jgi:hypothetical protein
MAQPRPTAAWIRPWLMWAHCCLRGWRAGCALRSIPGSTQMQVGRVREVVEECGREAGGVEKGGVHCAVGAFFASSSCSAIQWRRHSSSACNSMCCCHHIATSKTGKHGSYCKSVKLLPCFHFLFPPNLFTQTRTTYMHAIHSNMMLADANGSLAGGLAKLLAPFI